MAGGSSKRLGRDKRLVQTGTDTLIEHACQVAQEATGRHATLIGNNLKGIVTDDTRILADYQSGKGPLAGLISAMTDCSTEWTLVIAVDYPFLTAPDLQNLIHQTESSSAVITLSRDGKPEPLTALYRSSYLDFWLNQLKNDRLSLRNGIYQLEWSRVQLPEDSKALTNINYPQDIVSNNLSTGKSPTLKAAS